MSIYSLYIDSIPPLILDAPDVLTVSGVRRALGGESPTLTVKLDNARGHLTELFSAPPLRAAATVTDAGETYTGRVQAVRLGALIEIEVET